MGISIKLEQPGLLTTIQDQGRRDFFSSALSRGGAQDWFALTMANLLVGNEESAAGLEITGLGPTISFSDSVCIACCGAPVLAKMSQGAAAPISLPLHRPVVIPKDARIRFTHFTRGFRAWIAFAGGIQSPACLGSRSSHLAAEVGPPRLSAKTVLHLGVAAKKNTQRISAHLRAEYSAGHPHQDAPPLLAPQWSIADHLLDHWPVLNIPVLRGRHFDYLDTTQRQLLLGEQWQIDARSNRQGLALNGPTLKTTDMPQILSEPVRYGTVQLPSGGKPFILMSEHQTTGGYPRILEIVSAARPLLAQASPESRIRFVEVDLAIANNLNAASQRNRQLKYFAIQERLRLT